MKETDQRIQSVADALRTKDQDVDTYQEALKADLDALTETSRRQNVENLTLMKGMTKTMQVLKDNDRYFKENDIDTKEVLANMLEYFN